MGNDRYAYVNNSPINFKDPTGHYEEGDCTTTGSDCESGEYVGSETDDVKHDIGDDIGDVASSVALNADIIAFVINLGQASVVDFASVVLILGGTFFGIDGPTDGILTSLSFDVGVSTSSATGVLENGLGILALGATVMADFAYGNTDLSNGKIGVDTLVSARSAVLGLFPEVNIDLIVSGGQLGYDLGRKDGTLSGGSVPISRDDIAQIINFYWP